VVCCVAETDIAIVIGIRGSTSHSDGSRGQGTIEVRTVPHLLRDMGSQALLLLAFGFVASPTQRSDASGNACEPWDTGFECRNNVRETWITVIEASCNRNEP
jgi:hypothetical protein